MGIIRTTSPIPMIALSCVLSVAGPRAPAWSAGTFDGIWNVNVACAKAPDGALPYLWSFSAEVRGDQMLGYYNRPGAPNSATLSGQIDPGGNAALIVQGLTGDTSHTVGHVHEGSPFNYSVTAHFDSRHGTGKRNEARDCALDFVRR